MRLPKFSDKAILPQILLEQIIRHYPDNLPHPLIFKVKYEGKEVHMGVKEFSGEEDDRVGIPWVLQQELGVDTANAYIQLSLVDTVPKGTSLVLRPIKQYPDVPNWKYFLESRLRNYTVLTKGTILYVDAGQNTKSETVYELYVEDIEPAKTVCIIDTDLTLEIKEDNVEPTPDGEKIKEIQLSIDVKVGDKKVYKIKKEKVLGKVITLQALDGALDNVDLVLGDRFLTMDYYYWTTLRNGKIHLPENGDDDEWAYIIPFVWDHDITVNIIIEEEEEEEDGNIDADKMDVDSDMVTCNNCAKPIPKNSLVLHENFCKRNNIKCTCGRIFLRNIPETHWKCDLCLTHGDSEVLKIKHNKIYHERPYTCGQCVSKSFDSSVDLVLKHLSTDCPYKLHECRFCHLILPQEESTYEDKYNNLTHHESDCGNKTTDCFKCNKIIKMKDLSNHLKVHELEKVKFNDIIEFSQQKCCNDNCINIINLLNELDLCDLCYGSVYSSINDPTNIKLQSRLERKYVIQLSKGCGQLWCKNKECKLSGIPPSRGMGEILAHVKQLLGKISHPKLPMNKDSIMDGNRVWFCVDQNTTKRKMMVENLCIQGEFKPELVYKAVNEVRDMSEERIRNWLDDNAVKVS